ncbi:hypothetical protein [Methylocystis bryophila]|uniref:Uncharacterized protein n=1 Tax=Methylocystis bryophila TaxID=655015 RepID=A0A1W6MRE1_9HYPH|nr:hypothetical protein [Methylocystis bryophila]ARN80059.1 hypothetical protein B1812_02015 [Methylocystis bryophila]BDV39975.1 hypothetical protein DSM21852_32280 [Methylocystis bryophila]
MGYLTPPPNPAPVIVYKDTGGLVSDYEAQTELYRRQNREVRLHECRSACTMALSLPNVCVYPDAQVKFHQAYNAITREVDLGVSQQLFDSYPTAVRARLGYLTRQYKVLSGRELIALGMRNCNPGHDDGVMIASRKDPAQAIAQAETPHDDALQSMAKSVKTAVAKALARPEGEPAEALAFADRSPAPPQPLPAMAGLSQEVEIPLPPRRPDFRVAAITPAETVGVAAETASAPPPVVIAPLAQEPTANAQPRHAFVPRRMEGGTPMLATGRFYPPPDERQADRGGERKTSGS